MRRVFPSSSCRTPIMAHDIQHGNNTWHTVTRNEWRGVFTPTTNTTTWHDKRHNWRPSYNIQCGNDTTRRDILSLEMSAGHDKGLGGYSSYPRAIPSTTMAGIQSTFANSFFYNLLTMTTAASVMNKEDNDEDSYQRRQQQQQLNAATNANNDNSCQHQQGLTLPPRNERRRAFYTLRLLFNADDDDSQRGLTLPPRNKIRRAFYALHLLFWLYFTVYISIYIKLN